MALELQTDIRYLKGVGESRAALWTFLVVMAVFTVVRNVSGVAAFAWLGSPAG